MSKELFYYGSTLSFQSLYSSQFDGVNEFITKSYAAALAPASITYSAWLKTTVGGLGAIMSRITWFGGSQFRGLSMYVNSGKFTVNCGNSAASLTQVTGTTTINTGNWVHLAVTASPTQLRTYVNGVLESSANSADMYAPTTTAPLQLGRDSESSGTFFLNGKVAAPAQFNTNLTLAQVQEIQALKMNSILSSSVAANIVFAGYYPLGTGNYPTMIDYSGNGFNATLTNMENTDINTDVPT